MPRHTFVIDIEQAVAHGVRMRGHVTVMAPAYSTQHPRPQDADTVTYAKRFAEQLEFLLCRAIDEAKRVAEQD